MLLGLGPLPVIDRHAGSLFEIVPEELLNPPFHPLEAADVDAVVPTVQNGLDLGAPVLQQVVHVEAAARMHPGQGRVKKEARQPVHMQQVVRSRSCKDLVVDGAAAIKKVDVSRVGTLPVQESKQESPEGSDAGPRCKQKKVGLGRCRRREMPARRSRYLQNVAGPRIAQVVAADARLKLFFSRLDSLGLEHQALHAQGNGGGRSGLSLRRAGDREEAHAVRLARVILARGDDAHGLSFCKSEVRAFEIEDDEPNVVGVIGRRQPHVSQHGQVDRRLRTMLNRRAGRQDHRIFGKHRRGQRHAVKMVSTGRKAGVFRAGWSDAPGRSTRQLQVQISLSGFLFDRHKSEFRVQTGRWGLLSPTAVRRWVC